MSRNKTRIKQAGHASTFILLYRLPDAPAAPPATFTCTATSLADARAQCQAAYPGCTIVVSR